MSGIVHPQNPLARPGIQPQPQVPQPVPPNGQEPQAETEQPKRRRTAPRKARAPSKPRPVFIIAQVLDEQGNPVTFNKKQFRVIGVELSAEKVLDAVEGGQFTDSFYLRVIVPPRQAQRPSTAAQPDMVNTAMPAA